MDAPPEAGWRALESVQGGVESAVEGSEVVGSPVREASLGVRPHAFVRVQLGRVGREELQVKPRVAAAQLSHRRPLVDRGVVQEHDDVAPQVTQEMEEEGADVGLADVVAMAAEVEPDAVAHGADREPGDDGEAIVSVTVVDAGRLAAGSPGPAEGWNQEEARFVEEDEVRPPARCVFFTCGQRVRFQRSIRSSSRSSARRSGFWGLRPS